MRSESTRPTLAAVRLALLVGALAAIAYGIVCEEYLAVLSKGVRICLECMGIA